MDSRDAEIVKLRRELRQAESDIQVLLSAQASLAGQMSADDAKYTGKALEHLQNAADEVRNRRGR